MRKRQISIPQLLVIAVCGLAITLTEGNTPASSQEGGRTTVNPRKLPDQPKAPGGAYDTGAPLSDRTFFIRDIGHRCLDFGAQASWAVASPVYIYSCNGTVAQQVRVKEIDDTHDVKLMVQSLFCIGVRGGVVDVGQPLELQVCDDASPAQRFAYDGDAILVGTQPNGRVSRDFVIAPHLKYTPSRTPLVVATREVSDAEYFRFEAVDHSPAFPTTGLIRVSSEAWLDWALNLGWGTVIEIDPSQPLEVKGPFPKPIHAGVTLRGYRKYTFQGPEVHTCTATDQPIFVINENNVRITGLRLRGPVNDPRCRSSNVSAQAIVIQATAEVPQVPIVFVDHLDIGYFTASAVDTRGTYPHASCRDHRSTEFPRSTPVRVIGNFIHHISRRDPWDQYGSVAGDGAFILNQGNVFYQQYAHHIAADSSGKTGYHAYDNFFLSNQRKTHDVDMHGSGSPGHWQGGVSGDYFDVGWNTFLHTGANNINQRGTPCRFTAIHENVFLQSKGAAIVTATTDLTKHVVWGNTFNAPNPAADLAVGDFDGDGIDDVFVGTGAAWYFSSGGQAEWRFLNRMPEHASALLFGDLDGDGRTDIIALHGAHVDVSWGGISPWQTINVTAWKLSDMAVGDFDGDGRVDLFLATGTQWFYAPGGKNWTPLAFSRVRRAGLLFGDFRQEGRTRVLRVSRGRWAVAGLGLEWTDLDPAPVSSTAGLVVAHFDLDRFADVARTRPGQTSWEYSTPAHGVAWNSLRSDSSSIGAHPIGRFLGNQTSDVLLWDNARHFTVAPGGRDPVKTLSRQDMR
jgi:hypothetical protein